MNTQQGEEGKPKTVDLKRYQGEGCVQKYSYMLIRPPRVLYNEDLLRIRGKLFSKFEHQVFNIPFPLSLYTPPSMRYVILYLHGNSSSRCEGYSHLKLLPSDVGLACFDFNGCGNRTQKQFISLGYDQSKEVDIAFEFLTGKGFKVACWGRSMGAVSLLLSTQPSVLVTDSPFSSLEDLCKEVASSETPCLCLPCLHCFFPCFFWAIGKDVEEKTGMHPSYLQIVEKAADMRQTRRILLMAARGDTMIGFHHAVKLHQVLPGHKKLILFEGTHNSERSAKVLKQMFEFIEKGLFPPNLDKPQKLKVSGKIKAKEDSQVGSYSLLKDDGVAPERAEGGVLPVDLSSRIVEGPFSDKAEQVERS